MVLGGKTASRAWKLFPWNLILVPSQAQGEGSPRSFWVLPVISPALDRGVGKLRSPPALQIPGEEEKKKKPVREKQ